MLLNARSFTDSPDCVVTRSGMGDGRGASAANKPQSRSFLGDSPGKAANFRVVTALEYQHHSGGEVMSGTLRIPRLAWRDNLWLDQPDSITGFAQVRAGFMSCASIVRQ